MSKTLFPLHGPVYEDVTPKKTSKPYREGALPIKQRTLIEHCEFGDEVTFLDGHPKVQSGQVVSLAPSVHGVVTACINGGMFVRFYFVVPPRSGDIGELLHVLDGQRITRTGGYR